MNTNQTIADIISGNYILVDLRISAWDAARTDKDASDEITATKSAKKGSARVIKNLMAGADDRLRAVRMQGRALRSLVDATTATWADAQRIFPANKYMTLVPQYEQMVQTFDNLKAEFFAHYQSDMQLAMMNLGGLATQDDYPDINDLWNKFGIQLRYLPVPSLDDYSRIALPPAIAQELANRMADDLQQKADAASAQAKETLIKELDRMATQLGKLVAGEPTRLYDTLVTNMRAAASAIEDTNFASDPHLAQLAAQIKTSLVPDYRTKDDFRDSVPLARAALTELGAIKQQLVPPPIIATVPVAVSSLPPADVQGIAIPSGQDLREQIAGTFGVTPEIVQEVFDNTAQEELVVPVLDSRGRTPEQRQEEANWAAEQSEQEAMDAKAAREAAAALDDDFLDEIDKWLGTSPSAPPEPLVTAQVAAPVPVAPVKATPPPVPRPEPVPVQKSDLLAQLAAMADTDALSEGTDLLDDSW